MTDKAIAVTVHSDGSASVFYQDAGHQRVPYQGVTVLYKSPTALDKAWAWAQGNPLKVYALVALFGGVTGRVAPAWVEQALTIIL